MSNKSESQKVKNSQRSSEIEVPEKPIAESQRPAREICAEKPQMSGAEKDQGMNSIDAKDFRKYGAYPRRGIRSIREIRNTREQALLEAKYAIARVFGPKCVALQPPPPSAAPSAPAAPFSLPQKGNMAFKHDDDFEKAPGEFEKLCGDFRMAMLDEAAGGPAPEDEDAKKTDQDDEPLGEDDNIIVDDIESEEGSGVDCISMVSDAGGISQQKCETQLDKENFGINAGCKHFWTMKYSDPINKNCSVCDDFETTRQKLCKKYFN